MTLPHKLREFQDYIILFVCLTIELALKFSLDAQFNSLGERMFHVLWMTVLYISILTILKFENPSIWLKGLFFLQFSTPLLLTLVLPKIYIVSLLALPWAILIKMKFILSQDKSLKLFDILLLINLVVGLLLIITRGEQVFLEDGNYLYIEFLNSLVTLLFAFLIFRNYLIELRKSVISYRETEWHHKWYLSLLLHLGHNIRTPLAAILNNIDVIGYKYSKIEGIKQPLERIKEGGNKLNRIVNSVIHSSNIKMITEEGMPITSVVDYFVGNNEAQIHFKSLNNDEVIVKGPEIVSLLMALDLLTLNAQEYGEMPIRIAIRGNTIVFEDSGKGLPEVVIKDLEKSSRAPNASAYGNSLKFIFTLLRESGWAISIVKSKKGAAYEIRRGIQNWAEKAIS